jgi:signal transduction histidine kinase
MGDDPMDDMEKKVEDYRRLIDISRDLASTLDLDTLLERIVQAAAAITQAQAASILLYDDASRQLNFEVATNLDLQTMRGLVVPLEGSIAGWIVTNRQLVRIVNAHEDPRFFPEVEEKTRVPTETLLGVPLITKDKVVGVLEVINKPVGFTETDEDLLQVLSAQAAVAIENARLFQQSDLVAEFVHELRTPMASIGNATYLLLRPEMSQEQREQMVRNIHGETMRLNTLASSFLDLARLESGRAPFRITQFELLPMLRECIQVIQSKADENRITISMEVPPDFPPVEGDRDKLKQVVFNLVSNAIKYNVPNGSIILSAATGRECWTISVRDTGLGIPKESLPRLFEKFFRVHIYEETAQGTGLGLSICKQIVSRHGGSISVKSKLGEGTTFTIHLPNKRPA